jgi:rare lipoprotein A
MTDKSMLRTLTGIASALLFVFANVPAGAGDETTGMASFYPGLRRSTEELTAAHRSLPMGTRVRVTKIASGKSVIVRINDRGPFTKGRIIDVSRRAAEHLGMLSSGVARVKVEVVR